LFEFFYGNTSGYFPGIIQRMQINVQQQQATTNYLQELRLQAEQAERDIWAAVGLTPPK
jgi:hypothetical protein